MRMRWWWLIIALAVPAVAGAGKGRKHKHQKPGRAVLDRLASTTLSEPALPSESASSDRVPPPLDAAPYSTIEASATCGENGVEDYCREMPGKRGVVCGVCEGAEGAAARQHPALHALDGDPATWWQSPTLAAGDHYKHVDLLVTLPATMELLHVIVKSGPSPRPLAWALEVSSSTAGEDWRLLRAFGDREHCRRLWALRPERRRRKARAAKHKRTGRAEKPTCSTQFVSPRPLENGEMHVGLGAGVAARRVRLALRGLHPAPAERQLYTVRALTLAARCRCHGHAALCSVHRQGAECDCLHGTCGTHCSRCCNGGSWAPAERCGDGNDLALEGNEPTVDGNESAGGRHEPAVDGSGLLLHVSEPAVDGTEPIGDREDCACAERGECLYDDTGAILCVNCTENRAGPLCDRCLPGHYSATRDGPCLRCDCDARGSDGNCKYIRKLHQTRCVCRAGVTGARCDACVDAAAIFPACDVTAVPTERCRCDPRGLLDPDRLCDDVCQCKENVVGSRCDACAVGYYGMSEGAAGAGGGAGREAAPTCRPCYCSGVTAACAPDPGEGTHIALPRDEQAWLVTDAVANQTLTPSLDNKGRPYLTSYEVEGWESFYWTTPSFSGEQWDSYGGNIQAKQTWAVVRGDIDGNPTSGPDAILIANDGTILSSAIVEHHNPGQSLLTVPLLEEHWLVSDSDGGPRAAPRALLMTVLGDLRALLIRAHFHLDQDEVRLDSAAITAAPAHTRAVCGCPAGYTGAQCGACAWTHVRLARAPAAQPGFECAPCPCHGHAACSHVDGPCGPCQHNTTGPHCERCLPGHYGNPVQGGCAPCACPLFLESNNFSPLCALSSDDPQDYVCTQCPDGHAGDHCELCDFGYWGSPTTPGGRCQRCECGGSPCDPGTGHCLACGADTRCDHCEEGYYLANASSSTSATCVKCDCGAGALATDCDPHGRCDCRFGWAAPRCDRCDRGHYDVTADCLACDCGVAALSGQCDTATGACDCAPGAAPPRCDSCAPQYYGIDVGGCAGCNCSVLGAESNACDIKSGQCRCKPHVTGRACDTCDIGYWGLTAAGCRPCACGAGAAACDPDTGACACARGVTGSHCDQCLAGFYGFGPNGCLPCPPCPEGRVCSPTTGRCACPSHTRGAHCESCAPGYWGHAPRCQPCQCGPGASGQCDPTTGQCPCRAGFSGRACSECAEGHHGPRCRPCTCNAAGSRVCGDKPCPCDAQGHCLCKENVVGPRCSECREGTFGLSAESATGCTGCFCFGRAARCTQAGLVRAALRAPSPRHLTLLRAPATAPATVDENSLLAIHTHAADATIAVPHPSIPVYIELDKRFLGDRVTSYGGWLRFKVEEEGGEELDSEVRRRFPLVRMYGQGDIVLDYYERVPPMNGTHAVRLEESLWRVRTPLAGGAGGVAEGLASRAALMALLQQVERIMLRVTTRAPTHADRVHALLLNVSLDTTIPGDGHSPRALGVELCECGPGYTAPSCQRPATGFWLPAPRPRYATTAGTIVIHLDAEAQPCHCNGRATHCDPLTGHCLNCTGGTGGPRCDRCAAGHVGRAGTAGGCQPCPCPERTRNYASACARVGDHLTCLCKTGYSGPTCDECSPGFHRAADGECVACACDGNGALSALCDARGRCDCRHFATGARCDQCIARRTYLTDQGCTACDNCTQTLLDSVEHLGESLHTRADPASLSLVPHPFPALREFHHNATQLWGRLRHLRERQHRRDFDKELEALSAEAKRLLSTAQEQKEQALSHDKAANYLSVESTTCLEEALRQRRMLAAQVQTLDEFARGARHLGAHRAVKEARHLLRTIQDVKLQDFLAGANDVFDTANVQSTAIQERLYLVSATEARLQSLAEALSRWRARAADTPRLSDRAWDAADAAHTLTAHARTRLQAVRELALRCRLLMEDVTNDAASNHTAAAILSTAQAQQLTQGLAGLGRELTALTASTEEKEGILYNLAPAYRDKYLAPAERHAAMLEVKAKEYKELFAGSRALAAGGVGAARAWRDVAGTLGAAAAAAANAELMAQHALQAARGPHPLPRHAARALNASAKHRELAKAAFDRANDLRTTLESLQRDAVRVSVSLRALGWQERALAGRPRASESAARALASASARAERVWAAARALHDEAGELRRRARYGLRRDLAELARHGDSALGAAQEHVSQILGNTLRATEVGAALSAAAAARAREHADSDRRMRPALQATRDLIARARHAAETVAVSLTSARGAVQGCARAYRVPASAAVSRVALTVTFPGSVRPGTLLLLEGELGTYMRLSVTASQLQLSWQLTGSGEQHLQHPELLISALDDAEHAHYTIQIERIWSSVRLTVERAGAAAITISSSNSSSSSSGSTLRATRVWLGESGKALPACVHSLSFDNNQIGLWNFVHQPSDAQCAGCSQRQPVAEGGAGGMARFSGSGYAELRRSGFRPADPRHFSLAFAFKTTDHDALLFMARDEDNNRSVSVVLESCRVVFRVHYAAAAVLRIAAAGRHCHGRPVHVQAIRLFAGNQLEKGSLRVNGEETLGSPEPPVRSAAALPQLGVARYWVGGTPPGHAPLAPPLLGCLGALTVDRQRYDLMDTPARSGVEPGCADQSLNSATLEGAGYIELPAPAIRRRAALGLSFRARRPSGLLLYRPATRGAAPAANHSRDLDDDDDDKHYLAMELIDGALEVRMSAGKAELRLRNNDTRYDDGRLHAVRLVRLHKQLEVWVDEERVSAGALGGNALRARSSGLFVGGAPADHAPHRGFTGTVADLIVDGVLLGFETAVDFSEAALGRADSEPAPEPRPAPRELQAQPDTSAQCIQTASYTVEAGAVKFGDAAGSHATLRLAPRDLKNLTLSLQFRTFRSSGLLALIPGAKAKPKHYLALVVRDGKLKLLLRGRRRRDLSLPEFVADGTWRSVSVRLSGHRAVLAAGGAAATGGGRRVQLAARLHVGGMPAAPAPHLPDSVMSIGGLRGCLRRVWVGARAHDLARARAHSVGQCFPRVEPAAFFAGDAHAVWAHSWRPEYGEGADGVEGELRLRLQFRTTEPSGVLLAAQGFLLELVAGAVVLSRRGSAERVESLGASGRALCDGLWHDVRARVAGAALSLALDDAPELRAAPGLIDDVTDAPPLLSPLYVGGVPEGASEVIGGGKENFKGCIREVSIAGDKRDWAVMASLHNVLLDSCPVA